MLDTPETPTRLPRAPRDVHGFGGRNLWFVRLLLIPHICCGIGIAGALLLNVLVAAFGTDISAAVIEAHTTKGNKGRTVYHVNYTYNVGARDYIGSEDVAQNTYETVNRPGMIAQHTATVPVRHLEWGPAHYHLLIQSDSVWKSASSLFFFALFWNGMVSIFVYIAWVAPLRNRWLVRDGAVTRGKIVSRRIVNRKGTSYYATFTFQNPMTGQQFEREMSLPGNAEYDAAHENLVVTVLYLPQKPKRSLAYEISGFRVTGAEPA